MTNSRQKRRKSETINTQTMSSTDLNVEKDIEEVQTLTEVACDERNSPTRSCTDNVRVEKDIEEARTLAEEVACNEPMQRLHEGFIYYRPLHVGDRDQVEELHKEWFPVTYKDEFYDELVLERMVNTGEKLFTCAITYHEEDESNQQDALINKQDEEDYIIACVVGSLLDVARLDKDTVEALISDPFRYRHVFYIMTLGTVAEFRHARLATSLVGKCIQIVEKNNQCGALYLHVITTNAAAIRFYERLGFYRVKEIENYYRIDGKLYNCYIYARYFHGNRGQWDVYYVVGKMLASVWEKVKKPLSLISYARNR